MRPLYFKQSFANSKPHILIQKNISFTQKQTQYPVRKLPEKSG